LEEHIQKLPENRALAVSERRAADLADESNVIEAAVNAAISVLSKGSSSANLSAASLAAQTAELLLGRAQTYLQSWMSLAEISISRSVLILSAGKKTGCEEKLGQNPKDCHLQERG
jgi:hypothetical protein